MAYWCSYMMSCTMSVMTLNDTKVKIILEACFVKIEETIPFSFMRMEWDEESLEKVKHKFVKW